MHGRRSGHWPDQPDDLFQRYFWHWYSDEAKRGRSGSGLYPDSFVLERIPVRTEGYVSQYGKEPSDRWAAELADFIHTAHRDFERIIGTTSAKGLDSLGKIDDYFGETEYLKLLDSSHPADDGN